MSGCDYCERKSVITCHDCGARCCISHIERSETGLGWRVSLCNPDRNTHPQGGCYRPPISKVRDDGYERR